MQDTKLIFEKQRANRWRVAQTTAKERIEKLKKLKDAILGRADELYEAIHKDFRKNPAEVDLTEIFPVISEINHTIRHLEKWMKPVRVSTPLVLLGTKAEYRFEPKGVVLILSPWNYPFNLLMEPLVSAIAAGNCAILKPSSKVPNTSRFLRKFISELFPEDEVALFEGGSNISDELLELPFDHVFFTGSPGIGKKVMAAAAKHLAPVTLELGGKSPVIIDKTGNTKLAAERIMWAKFINAGQTCIAPDYLLIHKSKLTDFVETSKRLIAERFGQTASEQLKSADFCRIVSDGHLIGLRKVLDESIEKGAKVEFGGATEAGTRYLAPTLLTGVTNSSPIMAEEIFGPILPVITFEDIDEAIQLIRRRPKPLALYLFSEDKRNTEHILSNTTSGGSCVNSLILHFANTNLPFGGVGNSGMGNYHGYFGFITFSHQKSVVRQSGLDMLKYFYPPYTERVQKMIRLAIRYLT